MEYNKLISVTGFSGLFELVTSKTDGAVVRSLEDNTTKFVSSRVHQFSHLESIEVYTTDDNVNLADIFKAMDASAEALPSEKDNNAVKSYFEIKTSVLPPSVILYVPEPGSKSMVEPKVPVKNTSPLSLTVIAYP